MLNYRQNLQIALRERYRRLFKAKTHGIDSELRYFVEWISNNPSLAAILGAAEAAAADFDTAIWHRENVTRRGFAWPDTEEERAVYVWFLVQSWAATDNGSGLLNAMHPFADLGTSKFEAIVREATENAIEPLINYLEEHVAEVSDVLHLLARFKHRVEWFDHDALLAQYEANTRHGEDVYDTALRRFLFDHGVDYPFSQPNSPSGIADIVAALDTDDPLVCEVKLYDNDRYGVSYIAKGVTQAVSYARDYSKDSAYLVVVNLSQQPIQLPSDESDGRWPPRLNVDGVIVNMVVVTARQPDESASKRGKSEPTVVDRGDLVA